MSSPPLYTRWKFPPIGNGMSFYSVVAWVLIFVLTWVGASLLGFLLEICAAHLLAAAALAGVIHNWIHKQDRV